jgi:hypothetical protein
LGCFFIIIFIFGLVVLTKVNADADQIYLHYADNTAGAKILDIYQKKANAGTNSDKWFRWEFFQYTSDAWDLQQNSVGHVSTLDLQTTRDDFTYVNGSGDAGTWTDVTVGNIVAKRRISSTNYEPYSAYATYTATDNYNDVYLGVHMVGTVGGVIRVKINGVVSTNNLVGLNTTMGLNTNGEFDEGHYLTDNVNPRWIHIATNINTGDVITIEVKGSTDAHNRHDITGLKLYKDANPGDANWVYLKSHDVMDNPSEQYVAISGNIPGQAVGYKFGIAHGHEYNAAITINLDGTAYVLDSDLSYNQVIIGNTLDITGISTCYGDTKTTDDFGTLTRAMVFEGNTLIESWALAFTTDFQVANVYTTMWPADYSTDKLFRYVKFSDNFVVDLPNDGVVFPMQVGPSVASGRMEYFGGTANLKVTIQTTAPLQEEWITNNGQKSYFRGSTNHYVGSFHNGDSFSSTATITLNYETPTDVDWSGKTLYIAKNKTISTNDDFVPFDGKGLVTKFMAGSNLGLTFNNFAPTKTYFTSQDDDSIGIEERSSDHSPAKEDWAGISVSGVASATHNIFSYGTTGLTLIGNANAYNNSFNQNTTGINASSGSTVRNNALVNITTYTTGAGDFDYNYFSGNTETHGKSGDPLFINATNANFSLQSTSLAINSGTNVSLTSDYLGNPIVGLPDIGAYEFQAPTVPTSLSQYKSDGTTAIISGTFTNENSVVLKFNMSSSEYNSSDSLTPQVEIQELGTAFTNIVTNSGDAVAYSGSGVTGTVLVTGLTSGKTYHWQARISNSAGQSSWVAMGGSPDFQVDTTIPVITLLGESSITLTNEQSYTDAGATAIDNIDGDITSSIITVNPVDVTVPGTYTITYNVTDATLNVATEVTRTVRVEISSSTGSSGYLSGSYLLGYLPKAISTITSKIESTTLITTSTISEIQKVTKDLKFGMTNKDVKTLQLFLIKQNKGSNAKALAKYNGTNYFGKLTRSALAEWQKANKVIPSYGYFGKITRAKIKLLNL